jgi:hypothetical protein
MQSIRKRIKEVQDRQNIYANAIMLNTVMKLEIEFSCG